MSHPDYAIPHDVFAVAREAMVVSQLNTSGVNNENVLNAYRSVSRELFVPEDRQGICYLDDNVPMPNGRSLLEPLVHALMVEHADIGKNDKVLDIGGLTGYSAAILSRLCKGVVAVEQDQQALDVAKDIWLHLGIQTIMPVVAPHRAGCPAYGPYDVILINGAVETIPQTLQDQLAPQGRLVCVHMNSRSSVGEIRLYRKQGLTFSHTRIANSTVPYLTGLEPVPTFIF